MKIGNLGLNRDCLAEKYINFFKTYSLFTELEIISVSVDTITAQMEYAWFVEILIEMLITRASNKDNINLEELKELLLGLKELSLDNPEQ